ncbi:MAG: DNA gyrase subunit A [Candidatus Brocadiia bacterium]
MREKDNRTEKILIEDEMRDSYLTFAMSVIVSRALPDVRDGLKPVQRRILVAMNELRLGPRSKHRKCGKIVGDTHGNYHPHGDTAIYDTLVRMGQPFSFRYPLVDRQGNFGSLDGDPPAAMRYTAARLTRIGADMLDDLNLDTVDFVDNYEGTCQEPTVLPGRFPNLLANGCSGIAVGMATSIPPHNICEICDAIVACIENPDISVSEIMDILPGPDFPTGGVICGRAGILDGYTSGRGTITLRARTKIEERSKGRDRIVVTEVPYHVNRESIVAKMADAVEAGTIEGVSDIRNESDSSGTRISVELKRGADAEVVRNQIFRRTPLQSTFSIMLVLIIDGRPETVSIKRIMTEYVEHRVEVIRRRTAHLLGKAEDRAHVLEGLRTALINIDEVIAIVRSSEKTEEAQERLIDSFSLSDRQADAILAMRLQTLVGLEQLKIDQEYDELQDKIQDYRKILADRDLVLDIIREDLHEIRERYGDERRTGITGAVEDLNRADLIPEEDVVVTVSVGGYVKRVPIDAFRAQGRGGKGVVGADLKEEDAVGHLFVSSTHDYIMLFTNYGQVYWIRVFEIPEMGRTARGRAIINLLELEDGERVTGLIPVREFDEDYFLIMATEQGTVKKTTLDAFGKRGSGGIIAINLEEDDRLVSVLRTSGDDEVILSTAGGQAIRFHESDVRSMGRTAKGVRGIRLAEDDRVVDMALVREDATMLTVCQNGYGKRTAFEDYSSQHRGGKGLIDIKTTERNGTVVAAAAVTQDEELMFLTEGGKMVRIPAESISCIGRNTQGVRVVSLGKEDKLIGLARVVAEQEQPEDGEESEEQDQDAPDREDEGPETDGEKEKDKEQ